MKTSNKQNSESTSEQAVPKTRVKLLIGYDGTDFCGWQKQTHDSRKSIQETLETALGELCHEKITVVGSGRTDAGVHALYQVAHFDTTKDVSRWDLCLGINSRIPSSIAVKKAWLVPNDFHALFSATHKTYRYFIWNNRIRSPLLSRYASWSRQALDLDFLNECSKFLLKKQDFKSFQSVGTVLESTVREIYKAEWRRVNSNLVEFRITGSGFLKQMVRNIIGTELLLHRKSEDPSKMLEILKACDRTKAGPTADPEGLYLAKVYYPSRFNEESTILLPTRDK